LLAHSCVDTALEVGIRIFVHADIYSRGKAEIVFGQVLKERPELRDQISIQSKCGIRFDDDLGPKRYDLSSEWITSCAEKSLSSLNTEHLDVLLLHWPDPLMEPEYIGSALGALIESGKIKQIGVSNMQFHQIEYLNSYLPKPIIVNQIELSLQHLAWIEEGIASGNAGEPSINFGSGTIEYCKQRGIQLQSWGGLCRGIYSGNSAQVDTPSIQATKKLVAKYASEYQVSKEAIVLAWLMKHRDNIQPVIGTSIPSRTVACMEAETYC
jgi:predicted oxidoreductase